MPVKTTARVIGLDKAFVEVRARIDKSVTPQQFVLPVAQALAKQIRAGESAWPVDTGDSEAGMGGSEAGITNLTHYAIFVEKGTVKYDYHKHKALDYVAANIVPAANAQLRRTFKALGSS